MDENKHTRFEKARIIGARALQIAMNAPMILELTQKQLENLRYDPIRIAMLEYEKGVIPIKIIRV